jgi:hypothetical protein
MTPKERVRKALAHEEPDRVPSFELAFSTKLAAQALGRPVFFPRSGGASLKRIIQANAAGREAVRKIIDEGTRTQIEVFTRFGYDAMYLIPTEFLQPVAGSFGLFGSNYLFDTTISQIAPDTWEVRAGKEFWSIYKYEETSDAFFCMDDFIQRGGIEAFRRYVETLEKNSPQINSYTQDALESIRLAVELTQSGNLFIFGHGDICHPNDQAYLPVFLEAAATEPELVDRFFEATTQGILPLVKAQLELGVDGILGATDWCFKSGPIMSPNMVRRFLIPHLKAIAQLVHRYGKPFVQHLDGNTESVLPLLIDEVGIDGYHAIEPTAGMDIAKLKEQYGRRITLLGNLDCGDILINKSPGEIREETRRLIRSVAPGGGYILSSSNAIHDAIPAENLSAMLETIRDYGTYPIRI